MTVIYTDGVRELNFRRNRVLNTLKRSGPLFLGGLKKRLCPIHMEEKTLKKELKELRKTGQIIRIPSEIPNNGAQGKYAGCYMVPETGQHAELELRIRTPDGELITKIDPCRPFDTAPTMSAEELSRYQHLTAVLEYRVENQRITYGSFSIRNRYMQQ